MKSVMTLTIPAASTTAVKLTHLPLILLSHCEAGGMQFKMSKKKKAMLEETMNAPTATRANLNQR